jgi:hypothetical protein
MTSQGGEPEKKPASECTPASFQPILRATSPSEAAIQAELRRLGACKASLGADAFNELKRLLIEKR